MTDLNEAYLAVANSIVERLEKDDAFRKKVKANPIEVLTAAGLPEDIVRMGLSAKEAKKGECVDLTCWSSVCPSTCSVTAIRTTTCHCGK